MEGETCAKAWKREGHVDSRSRGRWRGMRCRRKAGCWSRKGWGYVRCSASPSVIASVSLKVFQFSSVQSLSCVRLFVTP